MNAVQGLGEMTHAPATDREASDGLRSMPGHLVRRVQQIATALFTEECGGHDLTSVQYAALIAIGNNPDIDATRLSALIAFDKSTLGDVLERLEAKGWIRRHASPLDRRSKLVRLSAAGENLLEEVAPAVHRVQERLLAPLDPADRTTLMSLLTRLANRHAEAESPHLRLIAQR